LILKGEKVIEKNTAYLAVFCFVMGVIVAGTVGYLVTFERSLDYQSQLREYSESDRELREANRLLTVENQRLGEAERILGERQSRLLAGVESISITIDVLSRASGGLAGQGSNFAQELRRIAGLIKTIAGQIDDIKRL
jgi:hypothetical protein